MFPLKFGSEVRDVRKIEASEFTVDHRVQLAKACFQSDQLLISRWAVLFLGAGEEKAVFCVCDCENRVFALELIDERTYLNGRFVGGQYFFDLRLPGLSGVRLNPNSEFGLRFGGRVRVREFVYGYEWSRFQFDVRRRTPLDSVLTSLLHSALSARFHDLRARYQDVHDRNVLFELRPLSEKGFPVPVCDWRGRVRLVKVGLQPIDVR